MMEKKHDVGQWRRLHEKKTRTRSSDNEVCEMLIPRCTLDNANRPPIR